MNAARVLLVVGTLIVLPLPSVAQEIYGRVWVNKAKNAAVGAEVTVTCDQGFSKKTLTDRNGVYRLKGPSTKVRCNVRVMSPKRPKRMSTRVTFYSSRSSTRANLELRSRKGRWSLLRR